MNTAYLKGLSKLLYQLEYGMKTTVINQCGGDFSSIPEFFICPKNVERLPESYAQHDSISCHSYSPGYDIY